jgi:DNA mismatch repair protein MutL
MPVDSGSQEPEQIIDKFINEFLSSEINTKTQVQDKIAKALAKASAISGTQILNSKEMREMVDMLFACQNPNHSPFGKLIVSILKTEELEKRFS